MALEMLQNMGSDDSDAGALLKSEEASDSNHFWVNDRSNTSSSSERESVGKQRKKRRRLLRKSLDPNFPVTVDGVEPVTADVPIEQVMANVPGEQVMADVPGEFRCIAILVIFAIVGYHYYYH